MAVKDKLVNLEDLKVVGDAVGSLKSQIQQKANIDGYYESMTVGNAEQLVATVGVEDSAPYNFRTAGGSADIGDRLVDKIIGGTVCWNQLQKNTKNYSANDVTFTYNNGKLTVATESGGATANTWWLSSSDSKWLWIKNHIYLITLGNSNYAPAAGANPHWYIPGSPSININKNNSIISYTADTAEMYFQFVVYTGNEVNESFVPQVFDLTQMFGSTIADYIYSLEQATAGAGVAWFRHLFPKPYYAYNPGELMSVQAASHITREFNAWDEEWEVGTFNTTTGANLNVSNQIRSKNIIKILPNTTYYWNSPVYNWTILYDADGNVIPTPNVSDTGSDARSGNSFSIAERHTFTTPANAYGMRFYTGTYTGEYKNNIAINLSWDGERDGEYEEYTEHVYPFDDSLTLRGIPKLDSNNNLYYDGDVYESDGTVTRKYAEVLVNSSGLSNNGSAAEVQLYKVFWHRPNGAYTKNVLCTRFILKPPALPYESDFQFTARTNGDGVEFNIPFSAINVTAEDDDNTVKLSAAKAWFDNNPVYVVYELSTPTTEEAESYQNPQIVDDFGTEEYTDAGVIAETRDVAIPVGHESVYQANLRAKLEMSPDSPDGDGDYIVRQTNGQNEYVPLIIPTELPQNPSENGTYVLKATVNNGTTTLSWEAQS